MARLWFFNPWNDLALGSDSIHYTPPPMAKKLAADGSVLPLWLANKEDFFITDDRGQRFWSTLKGKSQFAQPWNGQKIEKCIPWGWSRAARQFFINSGIPNELLPSDSYLHSLRELSHRRISCQVHNYLKTGNSPLEAFNAQECIDALIKWGNVIGKYPWSSSGRGIFSGSIQFKDSFLRRALGAISHQGSVIIEPAYEVIMDFSMLFYSKPNDNSEFIGFSLFKNYKRAYIGNFIEPQEQIINILSNHLSLFKIKETQKSLTEFINRFISPIYEGPLGIDMFIYQEAQPHSKEEYDLNPCVEINLRYTMGFVALALQKNHLPTDYKGFFHVSSELPVSNPFLKLNPVDSTFHFYVE